MSLANLTRQFSVFKSPYLLRNINSNSHFKYLFLRKWKSCANIVLRQLSHENIITKEPFVPFFESVKSRCSEASRSILVQIQSSQHLNDLHAYCCTLGKVTRMIHCIKLTEPLNLVIVEFSEEAHITNVLSSCIFVNNSKGFSVHSPFLQYESGSKSPKLKNTKALNCDSTDSSIKIQTNQELYDVVHSCDNISDQMTNLYNLRKLNDFGVRLRFLVAHQLQKAISGMFPNAVAYPFGSSVNGFGKMGCDLDLVLRLNTEEAVTKKSKLTFLHKEINGYDRSISQKSMEVMADIIQQFLPGCIQIRRVLQARVPIIKYYHRFTDVHCDLSMSNMSGVHMSDLLHIYGFMDPRVRPLVFTIREWAKEVHITNNTPGPWITNFSLTLLVLSFLQNPGSSIPILPSFNTLIKHAGSQDKFVTEDGINCTFLRDINKLHYNTKNTDNLESLLLQFFEYYSTFDFKDKAICLNVGIPIAKPDYNALYIVNPLERDLNVGKNVKVEQLEKFKFEARKAIDILRSSKKQTFLEFPENKHKSFLSNLGIHQRSSNLIKVSTLFEQNVDEENVSVGNK